MLHSSDTRALRERPGNCPPFYLMRAGLSEIARWRDGPQNTDPASMERVEQRQHLSTGIISTTGEMERIKRRDDRPSDDHCDLHRDGSWNWSRFAELN